MKSKILLFVGFFLLSCMSSVYATQDSIPTVTSSSKASTNKKTQTKQQKKAVNTTLPIMVKIDGTTQMLFCTSNSRRIDTSQLKKDISGKIANENPSLKIERYDWPGYDYSEDIPAEVDTLRVTVYSQGDQIVEETDEDEVDEAGDNPEGEPESQNNLFLWIISILALVLSITGIVVAVILYLKKKKQFEEKVVNIVANSPTLMQWRDQAATNTVQPTYTPRSSFDDGDFRDLRKRVSDLEDQLRKEQSLSTTTVSSSQKSNAPRSLYAESIVNDKLMRVKESPNEDSIFELKLQGDSRASVTIYRGSHNRILQNPSFLDGCDKQVLGHGSLTVRQEGRAEKDENGKWKLVSKVNVILNR